MNTRSIIRWLCSVVAFAVTSVLVLIPVIFLLAETPLHNGDDVPSPAVLVVGTAVSLALGTMAALFIHTRRIWSQSIRNSPK